MNNNSRITIVVGLLLLGLVAPRLAMSARIQFEVAAIRLVPPSMQHELSIRVRMDAMQLHVESGTLREIVAIGYRVKTSQVSGPEWIARERFDVSATLPPGASPRQIPEMLQALLEDRFGLAFHREPKDLPIYALGIGRPPLKLRESPTDSGAAALDEGVDTAISATRAGVSGSLANGASYTLADGRFEGHRLTMPSLASELERYADRPIVDETRLNGRYEVGFTVTDEKYMLLLRRAAVNAGMALPPQTMQQIEAETSPLPTVVQQVGLKLESRRMPVEVIAIDSVRRTPTEN